MKISKIFILTVYPFLFGSLAMSAINYVDNNRFQPVIGQYEEHTTRTDRSSTILHQTRVFILDTRTGKVIKNLKSTNGCEGL